MSKRFVDCGFEALEDWCFTDTETDKSYYLDYNDEIIDLLNELDEENKQFKRELDNIYLFIGRGDWSGLADYLMNDNEDFE